MRLIKRSKNSRQRGTAWHGWGKGKAHHKGAGNRGGRGNAGTGKRGDQKKPSVWTGGKYFGKSGFKVGKKIIIKGLNITDLDAKIGTWVKKGKASMKSDMYEINLSKLGYGKLLSGGETNKKITVTVERYSPKAVEKLSKAGGSIVGQDVKEA